MAKQAEGAPETATFQLIGAKDVNLDEHVGEQVEVSGIVRTEQQIVSGGGAVELQSTKGTTGTAVVETKTELDVKRLEVSSVKPTGHRCD